MIKKYQKTQAILYLLVGLLPGAFLNAQIPETIHYQGKVSVGGEAFDGVGQFKFALVDGGTENVVTATATASVNNGFLTAVTVTDPGSGYSVSALPPNVTITGTEGSGATATAVVEDGRVTQISVDENGSGYALGASVTVAPPPPATIQTLWSHDGSGSGGSEPGSAIALSVSQGVFSVNLGDLSLDGMSEAITAELLQQGPLLLRVWFDDGAGSFAQLSPDQPLASVPYALVARAAESVADGAVSFDQVDPSVALWSRDAATDAVEYLMEGQGIRLKPFTNADLASGLWSPMITMGSVSNEASALGGTVSGGGSENWPNKAAGFFATIGGGQGNTASGDFATIGGGDTNEAAASATVGGGGGNAAIGDGATIGGGGGNAATGDGATIGGGGSNTASSIRATIGGGTLNTASGEYSVVSGGIENKASKRHSTVGGGWANTASGSRSTVAGGSNNTASGQAGAIGGGRNNTAINPESTVAGGLDNIAFGFYSAVGGGSANSARGTHSTVPGGRSNEAFGDYSFAAGRRAKVQFDHDGTFVWSDSTNSNFESTGVNQFLIRAEGGVGIGTNSPATALHLGGLSTLVDTADGLRLENTSGAIWDIHTSTSFLRFRYNDTNVAYVSTTGSWNETSDARLKKDVTPVSSVLQELEQLEVVAYQYKHRDPTEHPQIGFLAQNVNEVFPHLTSRESEDGYWSLNYSGFSVLAIRAIQEQQALIEGQEARITELEAQLAAQDELESRLARLENMLAESELVSSSN